MEGINLIIDTKSSINEFEETNVSDSCRIKEKNILIKSISGIKINTEYNGVTIQAINESLGLIAPSDTPFDIKIISNNYHVVEGNKLWRHQWLKNGWKTSKGNTAVNKDLWKNFLSLTSNHNIEAIWQVSLSQDMERCKKAAEKEVIKLQYGYKFKAKRSGIKIVKKNNPFQDSALNYQHNKLGRIGA